jgi:signal transduction histidine kinase
MLNSSESAAQINGSSRKAKKSGVRRFFSAAVERCSPGLLRAITIAAVILVALVDLVTGEELSFFVFYFIPVSFAAWNVSLRSGLEAALLCTLGWLAVETLSGHKYSETWLLFANTIIRWTSYSFMGYFVSKLKQSRVELKEYTEELEARVAQRTVKLQEQIADLEMFAYSATHNLRAPLRAIEGIAHGLRDNVPAHFAGGEVQEDLSRMQTAAARMDRLLMDLVGYVQLAIASPEPRPIEVARLLSEAIYASRSEIEKSSAEVIVENRMPSAWGDNRMLYAVLWHLLSNALKFIPPERKPVIRISSRELEDGRVRLLIKDNGIGISPKYQERIFGLFEQLHSHEAYGGGTGMGLALAKKCVEKMGGSIGVISEGEGLGSTFWIVLRKYEAAGAKKERNV